ncbi:MAG: 5-(carboxyamino)imidazole ribonucleotide synthase [Phycisphaerales bacterium]
MPDAAPNQIIAVLGAGQLGRMLALAGVPLGMRFRFLDPEANPPASAVGEHIRAPFDDTDALAALIDGADAVSFEFENVPARVLGFITDQAIARGAAPPAPPAEALAVAQDRLREKQLFQELDIPTPKFAPIETRAELDQAITHLGFPLVIKTRCGGYDGKGQFLIREASETHKCWNALGLACEDQQGGLIAEAFVTFQRELSIIAVRARDGSTTCYPLVENHHEGGILRCSIAPAPQITTKLQHEAESFVTRLLNRLEYVGTIALELFAVEDSGGTRLLANEFAPRVHNSAHWTIEASNTSQFENHIRAITGLPLGNTSMKTGITRAVMLNLISTAPALATILAAVPGAHPHLYAKAPRAGRKLGHITLLNPTDDELRTLTRTLMANT